MTAICRRGYVILTCAISILFFQNCSGGLTQENQQETSALQAKANDFEVRGGRILDSSGQSLRFTNLENVEVGSITEVTVVGRELRAQLRNTVSGRTASVRISLDTQGNFSGLVSAISQPYFCLDQARTACEMVATPNSAGGTSLVSNCSSPIRFDGSFRGGVNGLSANLSCTGTIQGITKGYIAANVPIGCDYFNPETIREMPVEVIEWMAEIFPTGLTRHHHWTIARTLGYSGEFGQGGHSAYLESDPIRLKAFSDAINATANQPTGTGITLGQHFVNTRASGYKGVFMCGGHNCYLAGQCDEYGRRK